MSNIPNDLAIASEFAAQDIPPTPVIKEEQPFVGADPSESTAADVVNSDAMQIDDTLDNAIAGKADAGYESSDIDLSSDDDSSSSSSSSSDGSDSSSEEEDDKRGTAAKKTMDDEDDEQYPDGIVKTAHEIVDFVVEKPQFQLNALTEIMLAGSIFQIIDNVIVILCKPNSAQSTLDQGSLLVYGNREVMGEVFETFGPVARPYYSVRFNDAKEINKDLTAIGQDVYFVPSYQKTQIVETEKLRKLKGTDASNVYDEEVGEDELEFSDDEKEMEHRKKKNREKKMRKKGVQNEDMSQQMNRQHQHSRQRPPQQMQHRQARDLPDDFDSALAAYEQQHIPPRQQQSYADLMDDYLGASSSASASTVPAYYPPPHHQQQQPASVPRQQNYQSPADLVSALYKSYGGSLPTQLPNSLSQQPQQPQQPQQIQPQPQQPQQQQQAPASARSLFSKPPPPISELEKNN